VQGFEPWQDALIAEVKVARLATVSPGGQPHVVPACFAHSGGAFWIPVDEKPKRSTRLARLRNIESEPRVSLLFDRYDDDWTKLGWVRVDGLAAVLPRGDQAAEALAALRVRYPQYGAMALESLPMIRIDPVSVSGWRWPEP